MFSKVTVTLRGCCETQVGVSGDSAGPPKNVLEREILRLHQGKDPEYSWRYSARGWPSHSVYRGSPRPFLHDSDFALLEPVIPLSGRASEEGLITWTAARKKLHCNYLVWRWWHTLSMVKTA